MYTTYNKAHTLGNTHISVPLLLIVYVQSTDNKAHIPTQESCYMNRFSALDSRTVSYRSLQSNAIAPPCSQSKEPFHRGAPLHLPTSGWCCPCFARIAANRHPSEHMYFDCYIPTPNKVDDSCSVGSSLLRRSRYDTCFQHPSLHSLARTLSVRSILDVCYSDKRNPSYK